MVMPPLPIEIWQMILRLACAPASNSPCIGRGYSKIQTNFEPVKMSHVCRKWRELTLSDSRLWANFFFYVLNSPEPNVNLMDLYLERSRNRPLNVGLGIEYYGSYPPLDSHHLLATIFDNFQRWKTAKLFLSLDAMDLQMWEDDLYCKLRVGAPLLETLEVSCQMYMKGAPDADDMLPLLLWEHTPRLTKLAVKLEKLVIPEEYSEIRAELGPDFLDTEEPTVEDWALTIDIPYHQLTHLLLDTGPDSHLAWMEIAAIFSLSPNLTSCSLLGIDLFYKSTPKLSNRTLLAHLKHLCLSASFFEESDIRPIKIDLIPSLNNTLTAPSLQTLFLITEDEKCDGDAYMDFITRSECPISEIHHSLPLTNKSPLLDWIRLSSSTLRVISSDQVAMLDIDFARRMSEWDSRAGEFKLCPNLEKISVCILFRPTLNPDPFIYIADMLKARLRPPNGSPRSFTTISIPSYIGGIARSLKNLANSPYCLDVQYHAQTSKLETVWERE